MTPLVQTNVGLYIALSFGGEQAKTDHTTNMEPLHFSETFHCHFCNRPAIIKTTDTDKTQRHQMHMISAYPVTIDNQKDGFSTGHDL